jgi:hypothetical protein
VKPPLVGLAAFMVGLAGGTGLGVLRAPSPPSGPEVTAAPDSTADSASQAAPGREGGDTLPGPTPPDSARAHADNPTLAPVDSAEGSPGRPSVRPAGPSPADFHRAYEQVARILSGMKPEEAGKVLAHVSDSQVEALVRQMSPRQAARLLSLIPPERAGLLSRRLLERPGPVQP